MSWEDKLRVVEPYISGEQPKMDHMIKLNTNENPYPASHAIKAALEAITTDKLSIYPNSDAEELRSALAKMWNLDDSQIFIGNGSDEVLSLSFLTFFNGQTPILMPDVTYPFYTTYADLYGIKYKKQPVDDTFHMQLQSYQEENSGIIFCNPCNPTGIIEQLDFIDALLASNSNSIVIIDEAYADFAGQTAIPLLDKYDNLIITRTFSKARSLAGIRLGVALGSPLAISKLYDVKNSFNSYCVDYVAQEVGLASINDQTLVDLNIAKIIATRNWFGKELEKLGFVITDSQTNFVFIQSPLSSAKNLYEKMYEAHIIIRYWDKPRISNWVRITIGTEEEMRNVLAFLAEFIQQEKMNNSIGIN